MSVNGINNNNPGVNNFNQPPPATQNQKPFDLSSGAISFNSQEPDNPEMRTANPTTNEQPAPSDAGGTSTTGGTGGVLDNYTGPNADLIQAQRALSAEGFQQSLAMLAIQEESSRKAREIELQSKLIEQKNKVSSTAIRQIT